MTTRSDKPTVSDDRLQRKTLTKHSRVNETDAMLLIKKEYSSTEELNTSDSDIERTRKKQPKKRLKVESPDVYEIGIFPKTTKNSCPIKKTFDSAEEIIWLSSDESCSCEHTKRRAKRRRSKKNNALPEIPTCKITKKFKPSKMIEEIILLSDDECLNSEKSQKRVKIKSIDASENCSTFKSNILSAIPNQYTDKMCTNGHSNSEQLLKPMTIEPILVSENCTSKHISSEIPKESADKTFTNEHLNSEETAKCIFVEPVNMSDSCSTSTPNISSTIVNADKMCTNGRSHSEQSKLIKVEPLDSLGSCPTSKPNISLEIPKQNVHQMCTNKRLNSETSSKQIKVESVDKPENCSISKSNISSAIPEQYTDKMCKNGCSNSEQLLKRITIEPIHKTENCCTLKYISSAIPKESADKICTNERLNSEETAKRTTVEPVNTSEKCSTSTPNILSGIPKQNVHQMCTNEHLNSEASSKQIKIEPIDMQENCSISKSCISPTIPYGKADKMCTNGFENTAKNALCSTKDLIFENPVKSSAADLQLHSEKCVPNICSLRKPLNSCISENCKELPAQIRIKNNLPTKGYWPKVSNPKFNLNSSPYKDLVKYLYLRTNLNCSDLKKCVLYAEEILDFQKI